MMKNFASANPNAFEGAAFIFMNALYLKADFASDTFNEKDTKEEAFHNIDGTEAKVKFIKADRHFNVAYDEVCGRLDVPAGNVVISFLLPTEGNSISDVMGHLNEQTWGALKSGLKNEKIAVMMPKLDYAWKFDAKKIP